MFACEVLVKSILSKFSPNMQLRVYKTVPERDTDANAWPNRISFDIQVCCSLSKTQTEHIYVTYIYYIYMHIYWISIEAAKKGFHCWKSMELITNHSIALNSLQFFFVSFLSSGHILRLFIAAANLYTQVLASFSQTELFCQHQWWKYVNWFALFVCSEFALVWLCPKWILVCHLVELLSTEKLSFLEC